jgi:hypothetical protein
MKQTTDYIRIRIFGVMDVRARGKTAIVLAVIVTLAIALASGFELPGL